MLARLLLAAALALAVISPASAQAIQVVPDCAGVASSAGSGGRLYTDLTGRLCTSGGGSGTNLATSQATATTTAGQLCAARAGRRAVTLQNLGTTQVFFGPSGVTAATGGILPGSAGSSVTLNTSAAIFGLTGTGTQAVACVETY
jgi:hypothetical protein